MEKRDNAAVEQSLTLTDTNLSSAVSSFTHAQGNVIVRNISAFHCEKDAGGWITVRDYN